MFDVARDSMVILAATSMISLNVVERITCVCVQFFKYFVFRVEYIQYIYI